jgi:hypothetical protein
MRPRASRRIKRRTVTILYYSITFVGLHFFSITPPSWRLASSHLFILMYHVNSSLCTRHAHFSGRSFFFEFVSGSIDWIDQLTAKCVVNTPIYADFVDIWFFFVIIIQHLQTLQFKPKPVNLFRNPLKFSNYCFIRVSITLHDRYILCIILNIMYTCCCWLKFSKKQAETHSSQKIRIIQIGSNGIGIHVWTMVRKNEHYLLFKWLSRKYPAVYRYL